MKQLFILSIALFLAACSAGVQTSAPQTAQAATGDWKRAIDPTGHGCVKGQSSSADYQACLEYVNETNMQALQSMPSEAGQADGSVLPGPGPRQPTPMGSPLPTPGYGMAGASTMYIPTCGVDPEHKLEVRNWTGYFIEVASPWVSPLNCDAAIKQVVIHVQHPNGTEDLIKALPPNALDTTGWRAPFKATFGILDEGRVNGQVIERPGVRDASVPFPVMFRAYEVRQDPTGRLVVKHQMGHTFTFSFNIMRTHGEEHWMNVRHEQFE